MFYNEYECIAVVTISGLVTKPLYEKVVKDFGYIPVKDRFFTFNFKLEEDVEEFYKFTRHLAQCNIDYWVEFDGTDIYDYGEEGVNKNTES